MNRDEIYFKHNFTVQKVIAVASQYSNVRKIAVASQRARHIHESCPQSEATDVITGIWLVLAKTLGTKAECLLC